MKTNCPAPLEAPSPGPIRAPAVLYHATSLAALRWVTAAGIVPDGAQGEALSVSLSAGVPPSLAGIAEPGRGVALIEVDASCLAPDRLSPISTPGKGRAPDSARRGGEGGTPPQREGIGWTHEGLVPCRAVRRVASLSLGGHLAVMGTLCGLARCGTTGPAERRLLRWVFGEADSLTPADGALLELAVFGAEDGRSDAERLAVWERELATRAGIEVFEFGGFGSGAKKAGLPKMS